MGKSKETTTTSTTSTPTPSALENKFNKLQFNQFQTTAPAQTEAQLAGLRLSQQLLSGGELPGFLQPLAQGISPDITNEIVQQSLRDIQPQFVGSGLLDSGVRASIGARTAGDIRRNVAEFNLQNLGNLLNLGVGGQFAPQQGVLGGAGLLSQRLQGLRTTVGTGTSTATSPNPFLKSFQTSLGQTLGQPAFGFGRLGLGGVGFGGVK